jgi:hypothetical protein
MSVWDWIMEFTAAAQNRGDQQRLRLLPIFENASQFATKDPDVMLGLLAEGRALSDQLNEPWWVLFFDHWRLQALLHFTYDYRQVLDLAVRATLEARQPKYVLMPQRLCLHEDLIFAYVGTDPAGHAERIEQALDYMQLEVGPDLECRYCVHNCCSEFALQRGRLDEAEAACIRLLALTDAEPDRSTAQHHAVDAYSDLCAVAFARGDWDALRGWATLGEETARRRRNKQLELAEFLAWRAFLERRWGHENLARRLCQAAISRLSHIKALPNENYHDALCAYHEQGHDLENALRARDEELRSIAGKGRFLHETRCRVKRCRLLALLGRLQDADLVAARAVAGQLRFPEAYIAELDRLASGS